MIVLAIDPGPVQSAAVLYEKRTGHLAFHAKLDNYELLKGVRELAPAREWAQHLAIEMIASYGMAVGREVFETCLWIGRFIEAWGGADYTQVYRQEVKLHLCASARAKDGNVRQALIDRFGGGAGKSVAIGNKKIPGPLHGVAGDEWAALAVAVTYSDGAARKAS